MSIKKAAPLSSLRQSDEELKKEREYKQIAVSSNSRIKSFTKGQNLTEMHRKAFPTTRIPEQKNEEPVKKAPEPAPAQKPLNPVVPPDGGNLDDLEEQLKDYKLEMRLSLIERKQTDIEDSIVDISSPEERMIPCPDANSGDAVAPMYTHRTVELGTVAERYGDVGLYNFENALYGQVPQMIYDASGSTYYKPIAWTHVCTLENNAYAYDAGHSFNVVSSVAESSTYDQILVYNRTATIKNGTVNFTDVSAPVAIDITTQPVDQTIFDEWLGSWFDTWAVNNHDHDKHCGLTDDDHTQYLLLTGGSGRNFVPWGGSCSVAVQDGMGGDKYDVLSFSSRVLYRNDWDPYIPGSVPTATPSLDWQAKQLLAGDWSVGAGHFSVPANKGFYVGSTGPFVVQEITLMDGNGKDRTIQVLGIA